MATLILAILLLTSHLRPAVAEDFRRWDNERVAFWTSVYANYQIFQSVIHDRKYPHIIYEVKTFKKNINDEMRNEILEKSIQGFQDTLRRLAGHSILYHDMNSVHWRLYHLFRPIKEVFKYKEAAKNGRIRVQDGRKENFAAGLVRAPHFFPGIMSILKGCGLPSNIIGLIMVESLFYPKAKSKVGAMGLWQIMPTTAKEFIKITELVDERMDPFLSTYAACKILKRNFAGLDGSWPLALTAYNHGLGGMKRALRKHGKVNLEKVIRDYHSNSFGFASKNFYAQFLAATEIFQAYQRYFSGLVQEEPLSYDQIRLPAPFMFKQLVEWLDCKFEDLEMLNPSLTRAVLFKEKPVPKGYILRIPTGKATSLSKTIQENRQRSEWRFSGKSFSYRPTNIPFSYQADNRRNEGDAGESTDS